VHSIEGFISSLILIGIIGAAYFAPSIIAYVRKVRNLGSIVIINGFFGWTFIGWIAALAMACSTVDRPNREV
jgi:hypothetical protein